MIISVDHKALEWVIKVYLAQDKVAIQEILDGVDVHSVNKERFNLPTRLVSKTFLFRWIFGGSAYAYAHDPEFTPTSSSVDFWQNVIDTGYAKYQGIAEFDARIMDEVGESGVYISPSGAHFHFKPYKNKRGEWVLPKTKIYNYPVQHLGAKFVQLSRISLANRMGLFDENGLYCKSKLINTVHDDIWLDCPEEELKGIDKDGKSCYNILSTIDSVFEDLPANFERSFKQPFNLPAKYEIKTLTGEQIK